MNLVLLEEADQEMNAAAERYEFDRIGLGDAFLLEIAYAPGLLQRQRYLGRAVADSAGRFRCFPLRRFPYRLIYQLDSDSDELVVVAVAHQSRQPGFWQGRIQETPAIYQMAA